MVPRFEARSSSFMPMPVSLMVSVLFSSSSSRSIRGSNGSDFEGIVRERQVAELVERVGRVGDELAKKDLRMRVERVDDQLQQLTDFGLKFTLRHICCCICCREIGRT